MEMSLPRHAGGSFQVFLFFIIRYHWPHNFLKVKEYDKGNALYPVDGVVRIPTE